MKEIVCIRCPKGCCMVAELLGEKPTVSGNDCRLGEEYAIAELINPTRVFASTIVLSNSKRRLPVAVSSPVPLDKIMDIMQIIHRTTAALPIMEGQIIVHNIGNSGVNLVATRSTQHE